MFILRLATGFALVRQARRFLSVDRFADTFEHLKFAAHVHACTNSLAVKSRLVFRSVVSIASLFVGRGNCYKQRWASVKCPVYRKYNPHYSLLFKYGSGLVEEWK